MEIKNLQVLVMPNGEVICAGITVGWTDKLGKYLSPCTLRKLTVETKVLDAGEGDTRLSLELKNAGALDYVVDYSEKGIAVYADGGKLLGTGEYDG